MIFNIRLFNPFKSLFYLEDYLNDINSIDNNRLLVAQIWFLYINVIYRAILCLVLFFVPVSPSIRSLLTDTTVQYNLPINTNLALVVCILMICLFYHLLYFNNKNFITDIIGEVVVKQNCSFFLNRLHNGKPICQFVRKAAYISMMANQSFTLVIGLLVFIIISK